MDYLKAFLTGGLLCLIGQVLIDKTKLTPARILVSYVVIGVILGGVGLYKPFADFAGAGASVPLTGFGNILAQGVKKAVDKDGFTGIFTGGLTASALADLELAYAPQFGSAKDPVNMLGHVADNLRRGTTRSIQWHELDGAVAAGATVVDVRNPGEHARGAIPGSVLVPLDELRDRLDELPQGPLVVHCAVGVRGHTAARILTQHGRDVRNLDGGYATWSAGAGPSGD